MTTKKETPQGSAASLPVEHMPPLNVTTEGIPALEHADAAGPSPSEPSEPRELSERSARTAAWAIVIASVLVVVVAMTLLVASGLNAASAAGFQFHPSGERGYVAVWQVNHVG